jgi:hypothetical protein
VLRNSNEFALRESPFPELLALKMFLTCKEAAVGVVGAAGTAAVVILLKYECILLAIEISL